jgi:amidase
LILRRITVSGIRIQTFLRLCASQIEVRHHTSWEKEMRHTAWVWSLLALSMLPHAEAAGARARSPSGPWLFHFVRFGDEYASARVSLIVDGKAVTGNLNELAIKGSFEKGLLSFHATRPNGSDFGLFEGRFVGNELRGTLSSRGEKATWVMRRLPVSSVPRTHEVKPIAFSRTFNSSSAPVARLAPGDRVKTWTIDSSGHDKDGVRRSFGGNPQTGPFYIEGAVPGDTLVVKLERIALTRDTARSGTQLLPHVTTPGYLHATRYADDTSGDWILDRQSMVGRLAKPSVRLEDYRVPLKPFLGGIGVAPPDRQAIDARSIGSFGGNLDYNRLTEGVRLYFPVFVDGALLFLGDGHAAQGAGELTGDALETTLEVEFTVGLIEGKSPRMPRAEDETHLMAMGIAGSIIDATREATTSLAEWLAADQALSANDVALVMGTAVEYDIAALVGPQVNVVARIRKTAIPRQQR